MNIIKAITTLPFRLWLLVLAVLPLGFLLCVSFSSSNSLDGFTFTLDHYRALFSLIFLKILGHSLQFALICSLLTALIGYPTAYALSTVSPQRRGLCLMLLIIPFWTSSVVRAYAIKALLKTNGLLNHLLLGLGMTHTPVHILYTDTAVLIGAVYSLLPFMLLPLYSVFEKLDFRLLDAARDLGASRWRVFYSVVLPLTMPGVWVGVFFVFLPAMTLFYLPNILGGAKSILMGNLISMQFLIMHDWGGGAATSVVLTGMLIFLLLIYRIFTGRLPNEERQ